MGKSVFQLTALPQPIDPAAYTNALSPVNPMGDQRPLQAFHDLVDPVPIFDTFYMASGVSTETAWSDFLTGAVARPHASHASHALNAARVKMEYDRLPNLASTGGSWWPTYPIPDDWYNLEKHQSVEIDVDLASGPGGRFAVIGSLIDAAAKLKWRFGDRPSAAEGVPLSAATRLKSITFKGFEIALNRPWLNAALFSYSSIYVPGQKAGLYSSGSMTSNEGVLPLLTTSFFLATQLQITADWDRADSEILRHACDTATPLSLAGLMMSSQRADGNSRVRISGSTVSSSVTQIVGWVSRLIPVCPQVDG